MPLTRMQMSARPSAVTIAGSRTSASARVHAVSRLTRLTCRPRASLRPSPAASAASSTRYGRRPRTPRLRPQAQCRLRATLAPRSQSRHSRPCTQPQARRCGAQPPRRALIRDVEWRHLRSAVGVSWRHTGEVVKPSVAPDVPSARCLCTGRLRMICGRLGVGRIERETHRRLTSNAHLLLHLLQLHTWQVAGSHAAARRIGSFNTLAATTTAKAGGSTNTAQLPLNSNVIISAHKRGAAFPGRRARLPIERAARR